MKFSYGLVFILVFVLMGCVSTLKQVNDSYNVIGEVEEGTINESSTQTEVVKEASSEGIVVVRKSDLGSNDEVQDTILDVSNQIQGLTIELKQTDEKI